MKNKILIGVVSLILLFSSFGFSFAKTVNEEDSVNSVETVNIYQETDETIMSINNKEDRDKIYEFWYTPA